MKKIVVKVDVPDEKAKQKAMKAVSCLQGINSITMEMKERKMIVVGTVDPVEVVEKLRKLWFAEILTVGPPKEVEIKKPPITCIGYPCYGCNHHPTFYYKQEETPNGCVLC